MGIWLELTIFNKLASLCASFSNGSLALLFSGMLWYDECVGGKQLLKDFNTQQQLHSFVINFK